MRKCVFILSLVVVSAAPALVSAQVFPAHPALPSASGSGLFGGMFGRSAACDGDPATGPGLAFEIGYTGYRRGVTLDFTTDVGFGRAFPNWRLNYPLEGLWLGLSVNVPLNERLSLVASGTWLVPSNEQCDQEQIFTVPRDPLLRSWATSIQWYTLGAGAALSVQGPVSLVGGFRFDSFDTNFHDPDLFPGGFPTDEADIEVKLYMPYVGLVASPSSRLQVGFIGFPFLPGHIRYGETLGELEPRIRVSGPLSNGYFMEAYASCNCGVNMMGATLGFFVKWTYVHGQASTNASAEDPHPGSPEFRYDSVDITFDRRNWIAGGVIGLDFMSPF